MKFKLFHILLCAGLFLEGLAGFVSPAVAVPPPPPMVAVILPRDNARFQEIHAVFLQNFEKVTTIVGKPRLYVQSPNPDVMSLRNSIRKATALGADLIVVYGTRAATAAKQEDFTEPLIFADVFDPVAMGLVPSLNRGGVLVTGVVGHAPVQTLFKTLQETIGSKQLAIPVEPRNAAGQKQVEALRKAACRRGGPADEGGKAGKAGEFCSLEIVATEMQSANDVIKAFGKLTVKPDAIFLPDMLPTDAHVAGILSYAAQNNLPVVSQLTGTADRGAFLTLESDPEEQGVMLAEIASRMIDGDLPEDVPPKVPHRVSLTVNLTVARQLGIQVPFAVLTQTDRAIR